MFSTLLEAGNSMRPGSAFFAAWKRKINICVYRAIPYVKSQGDHNVYSTIVFMQCDHK
jgi:hypothetical protein